MTEISTALNYQFNDPLLLEKALTHISYAKEKRNTEHNEKLEFLGDAVLGLVIGKLLLDQFCEDDEGNLSKKRASLVNEEVLSTLALSLNIHQKLRMGKGELNHNIQQKPRILAGAFEAIIGAVYLDSNYENAFTIVKSLFSSLIEKTNFFQGYERDFKTRLQEKVQESFKTIPTYILISESGPEHSKEFLVEVSIKDKVLASGVGKSKKQAEQMAAQKALEVI